MNHTDALQRLDEFFYRELAPSVAAEVERHVRDCADCRAALEERIALSRRCSVAPGGSDAGRGDLFVQAVMRRIAVAREAPAAPWDRWLMPSLAAGLAAAVVFIVIGIAGARTEPAVQAADVVAPIEQDDAAQLAELEPARTDDGDQMMLVSLEE